MTPEQFYHRVWESLEPAEDGVFQIVAAPAPADEEVAAIERRAGVSFPPEFLAFSKRQDGLCVAALDEVWPEVEAGPAWTFWRGVMLLGVDGDEVAGWASIGRALDTLEDFEVEGILPLVRVLGDSDRLWGVDASGRTVLVLGGEVTVLDVEVLDVFATQVSELVQRQRDIVAGG